MGRSAYYPRNVVDEHSTVKAIINGRFSIARYGDGEFKLCLNRPQMSQPIYPDLCRRLREILVEDNQMLLVGIPRILGRQVEDWPTPEKKAYWLRQIGEKTSGLFNPNKRYFSSFITRPDSGSGLYEPEYWRLVRQLWEGRRVIIIKGLGTGLDKRPELFDNTDGPYSVWEGPKYDAYSEYGDIFARALMAPKDSLFLISLGPTATLLAADLCAHGRQALDLGHLGMFYAGVHPKFEQWRVQNDSDQRCIPGSTT